MPCFEIVDSRIRDWKIRIEDTVADNASSGLFVLGDMVGTAGVDFVGCKIEVEKNGRFLSEGQGSAALGSPLICVAWLANTLGAYGIALRAGEVILSGSLVPLEPVKAGDAMSDDHRGHRRGQPCASDERRNHEDTSSHHRIGQHRHRPRHQGAPQQDRSTPPGSSASTRLPTAFAARASSA